MNKEEEIKRLESQSNLITEKIVEFYRSIEFSLIFRGYESQSIRRGCQFEYNSILKELNKGSDIKGDAVLFNKNSRNRIEKYVTLENKLEFNKCIKLFVEFYSIELNKEFLKLG